MDMIQELKTKYSILSWSTDLNSSTCNLSDLRALHRGSDFNGEMSTMTLGLLIFYFTPRKQNLYARLPKILKNLFLHCIWALLLSAYSYPDFNRVCEQALGMALGKAPLKLHDTCRNWQVPPVTRLALSVAFQMMITESKMCFPLVNLPGAPTEGGNFIDEGTGYVFRWNLTD